jgi:hypothetical protein
VVPGAKSRRDLIVRSRPPQEDDENLTLRGFNLTQRDLVKSVVRADTLELEEFRWFQVPIARISDRTGVKFPAALRSLERPPEAQAR